MRAGRRLLAQVGEQRRALDRLGGEREHRHVAGADDRGRGADLAQPGADRDAVEPLGVRVRPRVVGVDGGGERPELRLGRRVALALGVVEPVADHAPVREHPRVLAGQRGEGVDEREPQLVHEPAVGGVRRPDDLAAQLHEPAVGELRLLDAPAGAVARLEHDDVDAGAGEVARGGEAGEAGAQHGDVMAAHAGPQSRSMSSTR